MIYKQRSFQFCHRERDYACYVNTIKVKIRVADIRLYNSKSENIKK